MKECWLTTVSGVNWRNIAIYTNLEMVTWVHNELEQLRYIDKPL